MTQLLVACGYVLLGYVIGRACIRAYQQARRDLLDRGEQTES